MSRTGYTLALAASSVFFGVMAVCVRLASHQGFGTWEIVTWRMGIGAVGTVPFLLRSGGSTHVRRPGLLIVRIAVGATAVLTYFWSIALLPVGLATLFNYLGPVFTALFAARYLNERLTRAFAIGMALALCGVAVTLPALHGGTLLGAGVGLVSAVLQGAAVAFIRELRRTESAATIFFWFAAITALCCLPFGLSEIHRPDALGLAALLGVGGSSLAAQLLLTEALGHTSAATFSILSPLTPITGFAIGALFLGEPVTLRIALGAVLAMVGVVIGMRATRPAGR